MLASVQERFDEVSYEVVDDFPTVDPDLVIVEVQGDNRVRGGDRRYQNHYVMFLYFRDGLVAPVAGVLEPRRLPNGGGDMSGVPEHASERLRTGYPGSQRASHQAGDESGQA